jgi:glucan phosphoethanolaminetransferase (alkaline phosphatase superfamily)
MKTDYLVKSFSFMLVLLYCYASTAKLINPRFFRDVMTISPNTRSFVSVLWWAIPVLELSIAVLLIIRQTLFIGFTVSGVLMAGYVYAMLTFRFYAPNILGGFLNHVPYRPHVMINLILLIISVGGVLLMIIEKRQKNIKLKNEMG